MNVKLLLSLVAVALMVLLNPDSESTDSAILPEASAAAMPQGLALVFDDFEQVNYTFSAEGTGTLGTDVDALFRSNNDLSGINASATYLELTKSTSAPSSAGVAIQFLSAIDFTAGSIIVVKARSESGSFPLTIRLANSASAPDANGDPSEFFELTTVVTNSKNWEELVYDFGSANGFSSSASYDRISFILDQGNTGAALMLDIDDVYQAGALPTSFAPLPGAEAEDVIAVFSDTYSDVGSQGFNVFGEAGFEQVDLGGNSVLKYSLRSEEDEGEEATIRLSDLIQASSLGLTHIHFDLWYAAPVDATSNFSFEIWNNPANWEITPIFLNATSTPALEQNRWISVDLSLQSLGAGDYDAIQDLEIKFDPNRQFGEVYLDNLYFYNKFPSSSPTLPIAFEGQQSLSGLLGNEAVLSGAVVDNPDPSGINTSARVYSFTSTEPTSGTSGFFNIFDPNLNLGLERAISFKVWSPEADARISIRLSESEGNGSPEVTAETVITKANEWTRVWIDFDELVAPQAQYDQISIFPEFSGAVTLYIDDLDQFDSTVFYAIDSAFEGVLLDQGFDSTGRDGILRIADALTVTELNLSGEPDGVFNQTDPLGIGMVTLDGIQFFEALIDLRFEGNTVKSVDLSQNVNLKELRAWRNGLESININGLRQLEFLGLNFNNVGSIDLSQNEGLVIIGLAENNLTQVSLPRSNLVSSLEVQDNNLIGLDISGVDSNLISRFFANGNPNLACIQVSNEELANSNSRWRIDESAAFSENCNGAIDLALDTPVIQIAIISPNSIYDFEALSESATTPPMVVEESAGSFQMTFEILYPDGVEASDTPFEIGFEVSSNNAAYALAKQPNGSDDYYLDLPSSLVSNDILENLQESISGASASFSLTSNGNSQEPDAVLEFVVVSDNAFEGTMPGESFQITVFDDLGDDYVLEFTNENGNLVIPVVIEDAQIKEFNVGLDGTGSQELQQGTITATLYRNTGASDGILPQPYTLASSDGALSFDITLSPGQGVPNATSAEVTDYTLANGQSVITIPVGQSSASFNVNHNQDADTDKDVYTASLTLLEDSSVFNSTNLSVEAPLLRTIIDTDGGFDVGVVQSNGKRVGQNLFRIREGDTFEIIFNPEAGAPLDELFTIEVDASNNSGNPAELFGDFEVLNSINGGLVTFQNSNITEARLRVRAILDEDYDEGIESFQLELAAGKILSTNFDFSFFGIDASTLVNSIVFPIEIVDVLPARITSVSTRALVEEDATDFAEYVVSLANINTSGKPIGVRFSINEESEAEVGNAAPRDFVFRIDGTDFTSSEGIVFIPPGERENKIQVFPNADGIPEGNEKLILQLEEGEGYTRPNSVEFPASAQIEILDDDMSNFDASVSIIGESFAFEQVDGATQSGFIRVSLNRPNDTGNSDSNQF